MPGTTSPAPDLKPDAHAGAIAILDSIVFLLTENVNRAAEYTKAVDQLVLTGGLASVEYLCQSLANVSGINIVRSTLREATAKGVGYLLSQDEKWPGVAQLTQFEPRTNERLVSRHTRWKQCMQDALEE